MTNYEHYNTPKKMNEAFDNHCNHTSKCGKCKYFGGGGNCSILFAFDEYDEPKPIPEGETHHAIAKAEGRTK